MALDITTITDYAWSDIAKAAKAAMVMAAVGGQQVLTVGKTVQRITPQEAQDLYEFAKEQAAIEAAGGPMIALVRRGERA
jgi:hypothetical protein